MWGGTVTPEPSPFGKVMRGPVSLLAISWTPLWLREVTLRSLPHASLRLRDRAKCL